MRSAPLGSTAIEVAFGTWTSPIPSQPARVFSSTSSGGGESGARRIEYTEGRGVYRVGSLGVNPLVTDRRSSPWLPSKKKLGFRVRSGPTRQLKVTVKLRAVVDSVTVSSSV